MLDARGGGLRRARRRLLRRTSPTNLLAALWATRALQRLRADLPVVGTSAVVVAPPPLAASGLQAVASVLRYRRATCLERSLVLQRWLAAHGDQYEVVIGVRAPGEDFAAHAWLADYLPDSEADQYPELMRLPPPRLAHRR